MKLIFVAHLRKFLQNLQHTWIQTASWQRQVAVCCQGKAASACTFFAFLPELEVVTPDYFANHIVGIESYRFWKSALLMHQQSDLRRVKACLLFMSNTIPQPCLSVWSQLHFILLSISSFENSLCFHRCSSYRSLPRMNTEQIASSDMKRSTYCC